MIILTNYFPPIAAGKFLITLPSSPIDALLGSSSLRDILVKAKLPTIKTPCNLSGLFNETKKKKRALAQKELFGLSGNWEYKTTQNYKLLQPTHVRCHVILCNKQPEMKW